MTKKLIAHLVTAYGSVITIIVGYLVDSVNTVINNAIATVIGSSVDSNVDVGKLVISTALMATGHTHLGHWFGHK